MKISLIQSRIPSYRVPITEPLGLGYLAAFLRTKGYNDIRILCDFDSDKDIIKHSSSSDIVGISSLSQSIKYANFLANEIKKNNPKTLIVLGGAHPTTLPDSTLNNRSIDYVVRGEGEITFYELVKALEIKEDIGAVDGVSYYNNEKVCHNKPRKLIADLNILPFPARDLLRQKDYSNRIHRKFGNKVATVLGSRGCPFECIHCAANSVWTRQRRSRSPDNIVEEIEMLKAVYGIRRIEFIDTIFTLDKKIVIEFCRLMREKNIDIEWGCYAHVNTVDSEMLIAMKNAGCFRLRIGVESGSPIILKEVNKGVDVENIKKTFSTIRKLNLDTTVFIIIGYPSESYDTIRETEDIIRIIRPSYIYFNILTPLPGSKVYQTARQSGYVRDETDWSELTLDKAILPTKYLSVENIEREYKRLKRKFKYLDTFNNTTNNTAYVLLALIYKIFLRIRMKPFVIFCSKVSRLLQYSIMKAFGKN